MGRLFWKFFLFIWLSQLLGILGIGAYFWFDHREAAGAPPELHQAREPRGFPGEFGPGMPPPPGDADRGRPGPPPGRGAGPPPEPGFRIPLLPFAAALFGSLICAAGLAWYVAGPVRHLRRAFEAMADGRLETRIGRKMKRHDDLADLGHDFDRMGERLEKLVDAQRSLLHDVSHEIRSPLARLQAAIGIARQQPSRLEETLSRVELESERINRLVGELLALSRLDAGIGHRREAVDLGELLAGIVEDARFEGAARQVEVRFAQEEMPPIQADPELLQRAIENIVRNALRHSPSGGAVDIEVEKSGKTICLRVMDDGPGVPEPDLDRIFQPFFRGSSHSFGEGYGLGLTIARRVVVSLDGEIMARNRHEGGLIIETRLPVP